MSALFRRIDRYLLLLIATVILAALLRRGETRRCGSIAA